jgi:hypothetical protein
MNTVLKFVAWTVAMLIVSYVSFTLGIGAWGGYTFFQYQVISGQSAILIGIVFLIGEITESDEEP